MSLPVLIAGVVEQKRVIPFSHSLSKALSGGESVKLKLHFANAGEISLTVPVVTRSREFATLAPAPAASGAPSPAASPTPTPSESPSEEASH